MQEERSAALSGNPAVRILNPQNQEMAMLRTSLLPGLLGALAINQSRGNSDLRLFEIGHVFRLASGPGADRIGRVQEESRVCFVMAGQAMPRHWGVPSRPADFYDLRGDVEGFLGKFALDKRQFISYRTSDGLTDNALAIEINGGYAGYFGEVRSDILKRMGVDGGVLVAELMLTSLSLVKAKAYRELPKYTRVRRDVAFIVDENVNAGAVEEVIRSASNELLQSVEVFDVFTGKTLPAGKKSLAFSLELMSRERTLTDEEIESAVQRIVEGVEKGLSASLRGVH